MSGPSPLQRLFLAGNGRRLALLILAVLITASLAEDLPRRPSPLRHAREFVFDQYQRLAPRQRRSHDVVVVEIDESSLKQLGQWPWPRNYLAALVDGINSHGPAAIGLDIYMPEPDATSPEQVAGNLPPDQQRLARELARLPGHDAQLAAALRAAPSVLGAAGFDFQTLTTAGGLRSVEVNVTGGDPLPYLRHYPWVLASLPELQAAARGQALLSVDMDQAVVRRVPLLATVADQVVPALATEMLRVGKGAASIDARLGSRGVDEVAIAGLRTATQANGDVWLHFAPYDGGSGRTVSATDIFAGRLPPQALRGKLVLIGLTGSGLQDMRFTPLGEQVPGIEIQAQTLESLLDGATLLRPRWLKAFELIALAGIGLLMVRRVPRRRNGGLRVAMGGVVALNLLCLVLGLGLLRYAGLLFDAATLVIGFSVLLASLATSVSMDIDRENQQLAVERQQLREEAARVAGELAAARLIQLNSLPLAATVFAGETRFGVAALLEPAREVGGDLYDFFMLDPQHLFFVVGDVSGKGVPASLFMAVTKALAKSAARRGEMQLAGIMETANREISAENPESLFVTAVAGIFNPENGRLLLCNAGHDAPLCRRADGRVESLAAASGPPMCVMDDFPYQVEEFILAAGDTVLVFTDGLTEANNPAGELFGAARLDAALRAIRSSASADELVATMRDQLRDFVGEAEPADDLTLLALQRH